MKFPIPLFTTRNFTILIGGWSVLVNIYFFPAFDVDTYHDGFIYPMALISSNGGIPNKSFFSMYGPIGPSVQGLWLQIFGQSLWILRLHGAILISVIGICIYRILNRQLTTTVAVLLSSIWLAGNPLIVQPSLPWVDLYTTLILLVGILYINRCRLLTNRDIFFLGILFALGVFAKINFAIPLFAISLIVVLIYGIRSGLLFSLGSLITLFSGTSIMLIRGSFSDYISQGIIFPLTMHDEGKSIRGLLNLKILLFGLAMAFILMNWRRIPLARKASITFRVWLPILLCSFAVILTIMFRKIDEPFLSLQDLNSMEIFNSLLKNLPYFPMFAAIPILWIKAINVLRKWSLSNIKEGSSLILGIAISCTFQLYPNPEPAHIWYIAPVVIVGIFYHNSRQPFAELDQISLSRLLLIPTCLALITINILYMSQERINHTMDPLKQMKSAPQVVKSIDYTLRQLSLFTRGKSVQFNCPLGIYSVADNVYRGSDNQYVDLIPQYGITKTESDLIFECDLSKAEVAGINNSAQVLFISSGYGQYGDNVLYRKIK